MSDQTTLKIADQAGNGSGDRQDATSGQQPQFDATALFQQYKDSVVRIKNTVALGPNLIDNTLGTGFVIDRDGTAGDTACRIATDLHVVPKIGQVKVENLAGNEYPAVLELSDEKNDLAILRIDGMKDPEKECAPMPLSSDLEPARADDEILKITARDGAPNPKVNKVETYFVRKEATGLSLLPGEDANRSMLSLLGPGQSGDSGGPGINGKGTVVGIISAEGPGVAALTPSHYLVEDLKIARQKAQGK